MSTEISLFAGALPAHARQKSKAMEAMAGGLAGGFGNRISIKGSRFRFIQGGQQVGVHDQVYLDVVIFAMAQSVQRQYYDKAFEEDSKEKPTCWSHDGKVPAADAQQQSPQCATCPQNVKGSARQGNGKACAYKKRVVMLAPDDIDGAAYCHDVNGQSMFGEQLEAQNLFSFKGYFEKLSAHGVAIDAIVTRMTFDSNASVPKLHFSPIRALTEEEYASVSARAEDEEVLKMLQDLTNVEEFEQAAPVKQIAIAPAPTPAPVPVAPPAPAAPKGVGGLDAPAKKKGFGAAPAVKAGLPPAPASTTVTKVATAPVEINLEALTNFDD